MAGASYSVNLGLGDAPDPSVDPAVWMELNKLQLAAKHIAAALGISTNGSSNGELLAGTAGEGVTIQDYSKVKIVPSFSIAAGSVLELDGPAVYLTSSGRPYPVAYAENDIAAGTSGDVTLLGMVYYAPGGLVPGTKYYVNTSVPGAITSTPYGRYIGQAFGTHVLFFDPIRV